MGGKEQIEQCMTIASISHASHHIVTSSVSGHFVKDITLLHSLGVIDLEPYKIVPNTTLKMKDFLLEPATDVPQFSCLDNVDIETTKCYRLLCLGDVPEFENSHCMSCPYDAYKILKPLLRNL